MEHKEWLEWRKLGLGASDAPVVMGVSPWKTRHQLWLEKTGQKVDEPTNQYILDKGHAMEPKARALFEITDNDSYPPVNLVHQFISYIRCSLDGYSCVKNQVLEIKYVGKEDHENAAKGIVPEKYYWQLQHQLLVSKADLVKYVSFDGSTINVIDVKPNAKDQKKLFKELLLFWDLVRTIEEPELTDRDFIEVNSDQLRSDFMIWHMAKEELKEQEEKVAMLQKRILDNPLVKDHSISCGEFRVKTVVRKGNVNYKNIPQLIDVDLEQYRGKPSKYQTIRKV